MEIDTEGVQMLYNGAEHDKRLDFGRYSSTANGFISRSQYYEGFSEMINQAKAIIYQRTQKFAPNYMVVGSEVLTILPFVKSWNAAPAGVVNGPYFAGTLDGLKVYVSPAIPANAYFFGINGSDLQTSAAVYAPYMAVVPTQLLGFADGTMSQGFSTMYDMKLLSTYTGSAVPAEYRDESMIGQPDAVDADDNTSAHDAATRSGGKHSWLLVSGRLVNGMGGLQVQGIGFTGDVPNPVSVSTGD